MAKVNTFFCDCGRTLGRPANVMLDKDAPATYNAVAWHARPQDGKMLGVRCGSCHQWWTFVEPKQWMTYADVRKSCGPSCSAHDHFNGRCE